MAGRLLTDRAVKFHLRRSDNVRLYLKIERNQSLRMCFYGTGTLSEA